MLDARYYRTWCISFLLLGLGNLACVFLFPGNPLIMKVLNAIVGVYCLYRTWWNYSKWKEINTSGT